VIKYVALIVVVLASVAVLAVAYKRSPDQRLQDPFTILYGENCAGCHGPDGKGSVARGLADPVFLQIADQATIRRVTAGGVPGTAMPGFAKTSGGGLADAQIDVIVSGMEARWAAVEGSTGFNPPPYSTSTTGDATRGSATFATFCARCHGADGRGGTSGGSIVDPSYLSLVSDQGLRTTVIAGRPDLGAPDWRGNVPGTPMSPEEVSDVVAWLAAKRP
jgi:mono/diheme cytochrome c family protein